MKSCSCANSGIGDEHHAGRRPSSDELPWCRGARVPDIIQGRTTVAGATEGSPSRNPAARQPRAHRLGPAPLRLTAPASAEDDSQAEAFASAAQPIQVLPGDYPTRETFAPGLLRGVPLPNALKINQFFESLSDPLSCCFAISKLTNSLHPPSKSEKSTMAMRCRSRYSAGLAGSGDSIFGFVSDS